MQNNLTLLCLFLMGCSLSDFGDTPISIDELKIEVFGPSREIGYTNKESGFFYTETNAEHRTGWQGWHIMTKKFLDDYSIAVDQKELSKRDVQLALVFPHQLQRSYPSGVQETITLLDSADALVIELTNIKGTTLALRPLFADSERGKEFIVRSRENVLLIARRHHLTRTDDEDYPVWLGATIAGAKGLDVLPSSSVYKQKFAPGSLRANIPDGSAVAILVAGDTEEQTVSLAHRVSSEYKGMLTRRKNRMESILHRAHIRSDHTMYDKALHWAILSMDALVMNQSRKGIFAGLPWFNDYWGRDSFIALPGATLVTGAFSDAREILRSFADWQDTDPGSPTYGRIPNRVTPGSKAYNTTDGTPWFVNALGEYVNYTGDIAFARALYPTVTRAIEGTLKYRVDRNILMTHGDAETWMDAVGPDGPWSPRSNRACDVQALWYRQLLISTWLAGLMNDERHFREWFSYAEQVQISFNRLFVDTSRQLVVDHLNTDGSADRQLRPNQIFALELVDNPTVRFNVFKAVTESLVYEHGVASLSQDDVNFHPYHHYAPYYVQDAAYHNGVVWTWLAGPWISVATRFGYADLAFHLTDNMTRQILDRGGVGTLSELLDAAPRPGESLPRLSGTFTQAWSLAEYVRVFYQDFLGVAVDAVEDKLELSPNLPSSLSKVAFNISMKDYTLSAEYQKSSSHGTIVLTSPAHASSTEVIVTWRLNSGVEHNFAYRLPSQTRAVLTIEDNGVSVEDGAGPRTIQMNVRREFDPDITPLPMRFATPSVRPRLKSMKGPEHRLLRNPEIKASNPGARVLYEVSDPEGDDRGPGSYVYPTTPHLKPGSLDATHVTVSADEKNAYFALRFRELSDPGWHPEYGFQLTFAAIAIDKDGVRRSGQTRVGRNANISLPGQYGYEIIVYIGGGLRVENARREVLAEHIPVPGDEGNPLGRTSTRTISFAIPVELIGTPQASWKYTVFVGAQDDHGGAGLGDFREVTFRAGEWNGGGKRNPNDSNVYDIINPQ
ncbi:MAG: hypothetical protein HYW57_04250 [Ignavibacteriales bacterium]|nr:hypothetical protein [Ignavibacteriales bacterium]